MRDQYSIVYTVTIIMIHTQYTTTMLLYYSGTTAGDLEPTYKYSVLISWNLIRG